MSPWKETTCRFLDLSSAGHALAAELDEYRGRAQTLVLAIASGGVPVAVEVAKQLNAPLDIVLIRRLLAPQGPQIPICAFSIAGTLVVDEELPERPATPASPLDHFIAGALDELHHRQQGCRGDRPPTDVAGKVVLLVDNGIHTGSTILAAIRALRSLEPARIIVAVPVADPESRTAIELLVDRLVCLVWPEQFGHVGLWYTNFTRPTEEQIREMLGQVE